MMLMQTLIRVQAARVRMEESAARSVVSFTTAPVNLGGLVETAQLVGSTFDIWFALISIYWQNVNILHSVELIAANQIGPRLVLRQSLLTQHIDVDAIMLVLMDFGVFETFQTWTPCKCMLLIRTYYCSFSYLVV